MWRTISSLIKLTDTLSEELIKISERIDDLECSLSNFQEGIVTCEGCKCLIAQCNAVVGKKRVEEYFDFDDEMLWHRADRIVTPYYCHRCAPKKRGRPKKK